MKITSVNITGLCLFACISSNVYPQQPAINLCPNPSFEEVISSGFDCPGETAAPDPSNCHTWDWSKTISWQAPDYGDFDCFIYNTGISQWHSYAYGGWTGQRTGSAYVLVWAQVGLDDSHGFNLQNDATIGYVTANLNQTLIPNHKYFVSFYTKSVQYGCGIHLGAYFSQGKVTQQGQNRLRVTPQVSGTLMPASSIHYPSSDNHWVRNVGIFTADHPYDWVTIGTFDQQTQNSCPNGQDYFIDDVNIIDLGDGTCVPKWLIENATYEYFNELYEASDRIDAGYDVGYSGTNGPVIVLPTADITYKAGNEVGLHDGFSAVAGSVFHAYIAPCGIYCPNGYYASVDISTGSGVLPGHNDLHWVNTSSPSGSFPPVSLVRINSGTNTSWVLTDNSSYDWINQTGDGSDASFADGFYNYELNFFVSDVNHIQQPSLNIQRLAADNGLNLYLNGYLLPSPAYMTAPTAHPSSNFNSLHSPASITQYYDVNGNLHPLIEILQTGNNTLTAEMYTYLDVANKSQMGLILKGSIDFLSCSDGYVFVNETRSMTFTNTGFTNPAWQVYPNPSDGNFTFSIASGEIEWIKICDLPGNVVYFDSNVNSTNVRVSQPRLSKGIYTLIVKTHNGERLITKKLIIN